jgi:hypothetical protein
MAWRSEIARGNLECQAGTKITWFVLQLYFQAWV